jgi:predicted acyl esterase
MTKAAALALTTLLAATALSSPALAQAGPAAFGAYKPQDDYSQQVVTSFYLPMRDGTKIAVSLHRPAVDGKAVETPLPVIWHHTLDIEAAGVRDTGKTAADRQPLSELTRGGYVVAVVARRGNGASFGTRRGYEDFTEGFDAYEITEWLAAQPWSDGQIGMYGCSNTGEAVMHAIVARPPHLKAAFAGCFAWDRYDGHTRGGIISQYGTGPTRTIEDDMKATPVQGDESRAQLRQAAEEHLKSTNLLDLMKSMPYRDSWSPLVMARFWGEVSIGAYLDQVKASKVPLYIQGGWYDDFRTEGLIAQANLPEQARIVIGPWRHCLNNGFDLRAEQLRFFDHYLKGKVTGIETDKPIHYFTVGAAKGQEWRSAAKWPLPEERNRLFLAGAELRSQACRQGRRHQRHGRLCARLPGRSRAAQLGPVRPALPPRQGRCRLCRSTVEGRHRTDRHTRGRPVDLVHRARTAGLRLSGRCRARRDGDRGQRRPPARLAAQGRQGAVGHHRYALAPSPVEEDHQPLKAGEPVKVSFDLLAVSYVFKAGHRIRIAVAGADPRERARQEVVARPDLTVHTGGDDAVQRRPSVRGRPMTQPFKLYMTGDLVLDEPNADFFFDPARAMLAEADLLIGHVEVPHTTRGVESVGDIPAPASDPENLRAVGRAGFRHGQPGRQPHP